MDLSAVKPHAALIPLGLPLCLLSKYNTEIFHYHIGTLNKSGLSKSELDRVRLTKIFLYNYLSLMNIHYTKCVQWVLSEYSVHVTFHLPVDSLGSTLSSLSQSTVSFRLQQLH